MHTQQVADTLIGSSPAMAVLRQRVAAAARSDAKVLITGESGTGKEVVASLLHRCSRRAPHALQTINCAGLPETLLESALFGHVRGSFTGADRDRSGLLQSAHLGTVLLDEVGEMSPRMQGLLLRFLENGEVQRVGDDGPGRRSDVRVVAATHRHLADKVAAAEFRLDLFFRLNVIHLAVPPLRERAVDVPELLAHFLRMFARQYQTAMPQLTREAASRLEQYDWPGNVRELRNVAERLVVAESDRVVDARAVSDYLDALAPPPAARRVAPPCPDRAGALLDRMLVGGESFWSAVGSPFMARDLTRDDLRAIVRHGLAQSGGSYQQLLRLFNAGDRNERRLQSFLRRHGCEVRPDEAGVSKPTDGRDTDVARAS